MSQPRLTREVLEAVYKRFVADLSIDRKKLEWVRRKLRKMEER
jgi:hypothetical protein